MYNTATEESYIGGGVKLVLRRSSFSTLHAYYMHIKCILYIFYEKNIYYMKKLYIFNTFFHDIIQSSIYRTS